MPDAYLIGFGGAGAAFGDASGELPVTGLAARAVKRGVADAGREAGAVDRMVLCGAVPGTPAELSLASSVAADLGIAPAGGAHGIAFGEAGGLLAVASAADAVRAGAASLAVAGGADVPARVPYWVPGLRHGPRDESAVVVDPIAGAAFDPASGAHRALASDGGDRAEQDRYAARSRARAAEAGLAVLSAHDLEDLRALKPVHAPDGTITAGNSAEPVEGAAVAVISGAPGGSGVTIAAGRIEGRADGGPAASLGNAIRAVAEELGTAVGELGWLEVHEESAAMCLAVAAELGIEPARMNPAGGAIATGAPGAGAGPQMLERAAWRMEEGAGTAVVAMPGPGGQAVALGLRIR